MLRRSLLQLGTVAFARALAGQQKQVEDLAVAAASQDKTPRVGIILSSFNGSEDHDGNKIGALPDPRPVDDGLNAAHLDAMLRRAIEVGNTRRGGLDKIVKPDDWVVLKIDLSGCPSPGQPCAPGSVTDLRVVSSLLAWLVGHKCGAHITIAEGPGGDAKTAAGIWTADWNGAFGGLSYQGILADFSKRFPAIKFDYVDLNRDEILELPVPGKPSASRNPDGVYQIPRTIQQCDRVISVAPMAKHPRTGVSLSIGNYFGIAPASKYGVSKNDLFQLGEPHEVLMDLYSYHTADYAILGGGWALDGSGGSARSVHRNVIVAGPSAPSVDAVGAAVLGLDPSGIRHLKLAEKKGFGIVDLDSIWTRGNELAEARNSFGKA